MRMITASFIRAIERLAGDLCLHFPDSPGFSGKISSHWYYWSYFITHQEEHIVNNIA